MPIGSFCGFPDTSALLGARKGGFSCDSLGQVEEAAGRGRGRRGDAAPTTVGRCALCRLAEGTKENKGRAGVRREYTWAWRAVVV